MQVQLQSTLGLAEYVGPAGVYKFHFPILLHRFRPSHLLRITA